MKIKNLARIFIQSFKMIWGIICLILLILVVVWFILRNTQISLLFHPIKQHLDINYKDGKEFKVEGIHGWHFLHAEGQKTILHCHGNFGNISYLKHIIRLCRFHKLNLIVFDYHGYGKSDGYPTPSGVYQNGETMYHYATKTLKIPDEQLILWGESLGGAVATHVASKYPCSALVLVATFSSLEHIAQDMCNNEWIRYVTIFLRYCFETMPSIEKIKKVRAPVMILHSVEDELIPITHAHRMFSAISHPEKIFLQVQGSHSAPKISTHVLQQILLHCNVSTIQCPYTDDILHTYKNEIKTP